MKAKRNSFKAIGILFVLFMIEFNFCEQLAYISGCRRCRLEDNRDFVIK